jgi:hypothetical protein
MELWTPIETHATKLVIVLGRYFYILRAREIYNPNLHGPYATDQHRSFMRQLVKDDIRVYSTKGQQ